MQAEGEVNHNLPLSESQWLLTTVHIKYQSFGSGYYLTAGPYPWMLPRLCQLGALCKLIPLQCPKQLFPIAMTISYVSASVLIGIESVLQDAIQCSLLQDQEDFTAYSLALSLFLSPPPFIQIEIDLGLPQFTLKIMELYPQTFYLP